MSSYLERQKAAFQGSLDSAASKLGSKKAPPSPARRKWEEEGSASSKAAAATAAPAPAASSAPPPPGQSSLYPSEPVSYGSDMLTQLTFVVDYLKRRKGTGNEPQVKTLDDILSHLSLLGKSDEYKRRMADRLRSHPRIQWIPDPNLSEQTWRSGTYVHRPLIPGVRDKESLVAYLRKRAAATVPGADPSKVDENEDPRGLSVKDLKDGWPDCEEDVAALEKAHRILVVRTKKDNHPRLVWADDPEEAEPVEPDYGVWFHRVELPAKSDIGRRLKDVGQKSSSEDPKPKVVQQSKTVKKRVQKRPGKLTNIHMEKLLKNYSEYTKP